MIETIFFTLSVKTKESIKPAQCKVNINRLFSQIRHKNL